jgi:DNA-binding transcriptional regulator LsrR (DeoR family)
MQNLDQNEVAKRLGVSRSKVSRLLTSARETGIVEIRVHSAASPVWSAAAEIEERFGLSEVVVENALEGEPPRNTAARAAARHLDRIVDDPVSIGFGWGRTLGLIPKFVRKRELRDVQVLSVVGRPNWTGDEVFDATPGLGTAYGVPALQIPAPALVASGEVADHLRRDPAVTSALLKAAAVDVCVVALGSVDPDTSPLVTGRVMAATDLKHMAALGAVGDVLMHFFGPTGEPVTGPHERHLVGLSLHDLLRIPRRIAVAAGEDKVRSIVGAARGGLITGLVTDYDTATAVLAH